MSGGARNSSGSGSGNAAGDAFVEAQSRQTDELLEVARKLASDYLRRLPERPVGVAVPRAEMLEALGAPMPKEGVDPLTVIRELAAAAEPGLVGSAGPRYFGFVIGGGLPVSVAADWLTTVWDQNTGLYAVTPAGCVVEDVASDWLLELLGLPSTATVGFVTGCQMASFTGLAAGRHHVLREAGWDVEERGLQGAPTVNVLVGDEVHVTISRAVRNLGLGAGNMRRVEADGQGRMKPAALRAALARASGPTLVCAQVGNVNTGAFDPVGELAALSRAHGAWLHVDGAFGLWAAASPSKRGLLAGVEHADSWATDAHKWLNVPYDSGLVIVADRAAHHGAMSANAAYLQRIDEIGVEPVDRTPEFSRRARGFAVYAALRALGREGVASLVERACDRARQFAHILGERPGIEILNEVVLNQVLVRFVGADDAASDALTRAVIRRVQEEGICWLGGTTWHGMAAMRISVSSWWTTEKDVERSAAAIVSAWEAERAVTTPGEKR